MVFVYIRIYFAAKARARRGIRKPRPRAVVPPESPDVRQTSFTQSTPATEAKKPPGSAMENVATIENQPVQIPIVTCDFASDVSTSEADPGGGSSIPMEEKDTLKVDNRSILFSSFVLSRKDGEREAVDSVRFHFSPIFNDENISDVRIISMRSCCEGGVVRTKA